MELKEAYGTVGAEAGEAEATFDHAKLDAFLREYVDDDGWVDYLGLKAVEPELDDYLTAVAAAPFDAWGRDEKLALLINAYNKPLGKRFGRKRLPTPLASFLHATWFQFDASANKLRLTELYDWYGDDFVQVVGSTAEFAARYSPELKQELENGVRPTIEWLSYDGTLHSTNRKHDR